MRILLSNDDGFQAPGIQVLAETLRERGHHVVIVAPHEEKSGNSHAMSFFQPVMVRRVDPNTYSVHGTPADCVSIALEALMEDEPPELVISGINNGYNVGRDVNYSGTIGAATEAALEGLRAIAVSMDRVPLSQLTTATQSFRRVAEFVADVVSRVDDISWPHQEVLNINHPAHEPKQVCLAECNGTSLWEPYVERMEPAAPSLSSLRVFLIGGGKRASLPENSEDVSQVVAGNAVLSFLRCRQSSSEHTQSLRNLVPALGACRS